MILHLGERRRPQTEVSSTVARTCQTVPHYRGRFSEPPRKLNELGLLSFLVECIRSQDRLQVIWKPVIPTVLDVSDDT